MSEWLKIVKKHAKLNPGKSLKEYLPDAQAEYKKLKASGKVVLKSAVEKTKKVTGKLMHKKKHRKNKKQKGGNKDSDDTDPDDTDADIDVDETDVDMNDIEDEEVAEEDEELADEYREEREQERYGGRKRDISGGDDIAGGGKDGSLNYVAPISMRGRTRAGGESKWKGNRGKGMKKGASRRGGRSGKKGRRSSRKGGRSGKKGGKKSKAFDVATSQMLAAAPMMMRARSSARVGGRKMKRSGRKTMKNRKTARSDITAINLV